MSDVNKTIVAVFRNGEREIQTDAVWQWDKGRVLQVAGITLPENWEAHVSNNGKNDAQTLIGTGNTLGNGGTLDGFLESGKPVYVWIYLTEMDGETVVGVTEYMIVIPVKRRSKPAEYTPTESQHNAIAQAINAMNSTVEAVTEMAEAMNTAKIVAEASAQNAMGSAEAAGQYAINASASEELADQSRAAAEVAAQEAGGYRDEVSGYAQDAEAAAGAAQDAAEAAVNARNDAVEANEAVQLALQIQPTIIDGYWFTWDPAANGYINTNVKAQGEQGPVGESGRGISRIVRNPDYSITIYLTDGYAYTTPSLKGDKGDKGDTYELTQEDRETIARIAENNFTHAVTTMYNTVEADTQAVARDRTDVSTMRSDAEAYSVGSRHGTDVDNTDPAYQNNGKYYHEQTAQNAQNAASSAQNAASSEQNAAASASTASTAADSASQSAASATASGGLASDMAEKAECWARGSKDGVDVKNGSPYYENNAKYYCDRAQYAVATAGFMDLKIDDNGHLIYEHTHNIENIDFALEEGRLIALWP